MSRMLMDKATNRSSLVDEKEESMPRSRILLSYSILRCILCFTLFCASCFTPCIQSVNAQEYTINPGDTITITVWEKDSLSGNVIVDANGYIALPPPIGSVKASGLTATEISQLLTERMKEYVKNPTVFVSVTPVQGFMVHVLGEVQSPNFYQVPEGTSIQEVITRAGGFTQLADMKHIRLMSKGEGDEIQERVVDFSQFVEDTNLNANPVLKSKDVLIVPRLSRAERAVQTVTVIGAVNSRGTFTVEESTPLIEVLALAGWPSDDADMQNVSILNISDDKPAWKRVNLESFLAGDISSDAPDISPGEIVFVPKLETAEEKPSFPVSVVGQVKQAGVFPITEGTRLFDAIYMAGGITDNASIDNVTIIHTRPNSPVKVEMNLKNYLTLGDLSHNPELMEGDTVIVPMSEDAREVPGIHTTFSPSIRVSIMGEVAKPNTYQMSPDSSMLDVLKLAGGPTADADLKRVTVIREQTEGEQRLKVDMEKVLTEAEFALLPSLQKDDNIFVPRGKEKRQIWRIMVQLAADVATIAIAYYLVTGKRYN